MCTCSYIVCTLWNVRWPMRWSWRIFQLPHAAAENYRVPTSGRSSLCVRALRVASGTSRTSMNTIPTLGVKTALM